MDFREYIETHYRNEYDKDRFIHFMDGDSEDEYVEKKLEGRDTTNLCSWVRSVLGQ